VMKHDEITGQKYSAMSVHEYALQALKTTRPLVFKPDVARHFQAHVGGTGVGYKITG
jgi:hypothetical protein